MRQVHFRTREDAKPGLSPQRTPKVDTSYGSSHLGPLVCTSVSRGLEDEVYFYAKLHD